MVSKPCNYCNKLLNKVQIINEQVINKTLETKYWHNRLNNSRFLGISKDVLKIFQKQYEESWMENILLKEKQRKRHIKLSQHYKLKHLLK